MTTPGFSLFAIGPKGQQQAADDATATPYDEPTATDDPTPGDATAKPTAVSEESEPVREPLSTGLEGVLLLIGVVVVVFGLVVIHRRTG